MGDLWLRILAFTLGLAVVLLCLRSIIMMALINQPRHDPIHDAANQFVWLVYKLVYHPKRLTGDSVVLSNRIMSWYWPSAQLLTIAFWFALISFGFSGLFFGSRATEGWIESFISSGSAISTLGFLTPKNLQGQLLAIIEGAIGLFVDVFLLTLIPSMLSDVRARSSETASIYARAGAPPSGVGLLEWFYRNGKLGELGSRLGAWEAWFHSLGESHTASPMLSMARSPRPGQHWLLASASILDMALLATTLPDRALAASARLCLASGIQTLTLIAQALGPHVPPTSPDQPPEPTFEQFELACHRLQSVGVPLGQDLHPLWHDYLRQRATYAPLLAVLAKYMLVLLPPWLPPPDSRLPPG